MTANLAQPGGATQTGETTQSSAAGTNADAEEWRELFEPQSAEQVSVVSNSVEFYFANSNRKTCLNDENYKVILRFNVGPKILNFLTSIFINHSRDSNNVT